MPLDCQPKLIESSFDFSHRSEPNRLRVGERSEARHCLRLITLMNFCLVAAHALTAGLHESGFVGEDDGLDAVAEVEFLEDAGDVGFGGVFADDKLSCNLGV